MNEIHLLNKSILQQLYIFGKKTKVWPKLDQLFFTLANVVQRMPKFFIGLLGATLNAFESMILNLTLPL